MEMKNVATMEVEIKESGPQGEQGPRGLSAYEVYLENGGVLSEADWLESLKGETGKSGVDGKDGHTPIKGEDYFTDDDMASLNIPRKTSQLENDSGFIAEIPDNYAKKEYVDDAIANSGSSNVFIIEQNVQINGDFITMPASFKNEIVAIINECFEKNIPDPVIMIKGTSPCTFYLKGPKSLLNFTSGYITFTSGLYTSDSRFAIDGRGNTKNHHIREIVMCISEAKKVNNTLEINPDYGKVTIDYGYLQIYTNEEVLLKTNTTSYTPTGDYNPATKKYVDDGVADSKIPIIYLKNSVYHSIVTQNRNASLWLNADANAITQFNDIFTAYKDKLLKEFYIMPSDDNVTQSGYKKPSFLHFALHATVLPDTMNENKPVEYIAETLSYTDPTVVTRYILPVSFSYDSSGKFNGTFSSNITLKARTLLTTNNTTSYTPTGDYHPATKKYVDDAISSIEIPESGGESGGSTKEIPYLYVSTVWLPNSSSTVTLSKSELTELSGYITNSLDKICEIAVECNGVVPGVLHTEHPLKSNETSITLSGTYSTRTGSAVYFYTLNVQGSWTDDIYTATYANVARATNIQKSDFLAKNNTTSFTPTSDHHPATKKYVDDAIANIDIDISNVDIQQVEAVYNLTNSTISSLFSAVNLLISDSLVPGYRNALKKSVEAGYKSFLINIWFTKIGELIELAYFVDGETIQARCKPIITSEAGQYGYISIYEPIIENKISTISEIDTTEYFIGFNFKTRGGASCLTKENTSEFTPTSDYNPATKKYVDDAVTAAITTVLEGEY